MAGFSSEPKLDTFMKLFTIRTILGISSKCYKVNHSSSALSILVPSFLSLSSDDPIVQIEIDNSRHILYTRLESGTIEVYDLSVDGTGMSNVTSRTLSSIVSSASVIARTIDVSNFKPIVSINAIEESESSVVSLVAVTESGVRLFFATSHSDYPRSGQRPNTLQLVHIRLPPGYSSASAAVGKPSRVHLTSYSRGTTLFVSIQNEEQDNLWLLNNDIFAFYPDLMEVSSIVNLNSRVWKLVEEPRPALVKQLVHRNTITGTSTNTIQLEAPLLVTQDMEEQRKFVLLSTNGVHIIYKPRPVDHLKQLLMDNQGVDNEAVKGFFQLFGDLQASVACLSLACNQVSPCDKQVAEWATLAFFKYSSDVSPLIGQHHHQQQQQTFAMGSQQTYGSPMQTPNVTFGTPRPFGGPAPFMASSPIHSQMVTSPMASPNLGSSFTTMSASFVQGQADDTRPNERIFSSTQRFVSVLFKNYPTVLELPRDDPLSEPNRVGSERKCHKFYPDLRTCPVHQQVEQFEGVPGQEHSTAKWKYACQCQLLEC